MYTTSYGFGDPATWGPVASPMDPRYAPVTRRVQFAMPLGLGEVAVWVIGTANDGELESTEEVWFNGVDILPTLNLSALEEIRAFFGRHAHLLRAARAPHPAREQVA